MAIRWGAQSFGRVVLMLAMLWLVHELVGTIVGLPLSTPPRPASVGATTDEEAPASISVSPREATLPRPAAVPSKVPAAAAAALPVVKVPPDPSPCSEAQAGFQEKYFSVFADCGRRLGCVADKWEELIAEAMPAASVFIDIGMNKGYSSANFFALWAAELKFNPQRVHDVLKDEESLASESKNMQPSCGACHDCTQVYHVPAVVKPHKIEVYGYEPGLTNFELCGKIRKAHPDAAWHLFRMAVADKAGKATFPVDQDETGAIGGAGVETEITTVDTILSVNKLDHVDMLKIDTEGFDPLVLAGSEAAFKTHTVAVTLFEYHKLNKWWEISLESVVKKLDKVGYTCFLAGRDYVLRLSSCWRPMMEFKWWSNVICVSRVKAMAVVTALDKRSFHLSGEQRFNGKPATDLEKGFNSTYVYGAPMFGALPQNTGGGQKDFAWAD